LILENWQSPFYCIWSFDGGKDRFVGGDQSEPLYASRENGLSVIASDYRSSAIVVRPIFK
jgi:hypothetical protein